MCSLSILSSFTASLLIGINTSSSFEPKSEKVGNLASSSIELRMIAGKTLLKLPNLFEMSLVSRSVILTFSSYCTEFSYKLVSCFENDAESELSAYLFVELHATKAVELSILRFFKVVSLLIVLRKQ